MLRSTKDDQGSYDCTVTDHAGNQQTKTEFVQIQDKAESFLRVTYDGYQTLDRTIGSGDTSDIQWVVHIDSHPQPTVEW